MGEHKTEIVERQFETSSSLFKYALLNEWGLRLIDWVHNFKELDDNHEEQSNFDLSSDNLITNDIHLAALTPFSGMKNQPSTIREFLRLYRMEAEISGNIMSYIIQEELGYIRETNQQAPQLYQTYGRLIRHFKQMSEIIISLLLELIKTKIESNISRPNEEYSGGEDVSLLYLNVLKEFDNVVNPKILATSQLLEAKIRYPLESVLNPHNFTPESLLDKSKGFTLEGCSTKAKLMFNECCKAILEAKLVLIKTIIKSSFDNILEELSQLSDTKLVQSAKTKNITMIEKQPLSNVRTYVLEILEVICSFLIKVYDSWGTDMEGLWAPKLLTYIFTIESDFLTQYEFELTPSILRQIYYEFEFIFEVTEGILNKHSQCDQKGSELAQKLLQFIVKAQSRNEGKKSISKGQLEDKDVFSAIELNQMTKSIRNLRFIHEYNFKILS